MHANVLRHGHAVTRTTGTRFPVTERLLGPERVMFLTTGRRQGKTLALVQYVACVLFADPEAHIHIMSIGDRTSKALAKMLFDIDGVRAFADRVTIGNKFDDLLFASSTTHFVIDNLEYTLLSTTWLRSLTSTHTLRASFTILSPVVRDYLTGAGDTVASFAFVDENPRLHTLLGTRIGIFDTHAFEAFAEQFVVDDVAQSLVLAVDMAALTSAMTELAIVAPIGFGECYSCNAPNPNCIAYLAHLFDDLHPNWANSVDMCHLDHNVQLFYELTRRTTFALEAIANAMYRAILIDDRALARYIGEHFPDAINDDVRDLARLLHRRVILADMPPRE
jgi:hypothetical protein